MELNTSATRAQWTSTTSYFWVTVGAVVGIGNILLFPFLVFQYGGLFLLFYLLCELGIALPLLYTELMIGRHSKQNTVGAIELLCYENKASLLWQKIGWLYFAIAFLTFSYYVAYAALPIGLLIDALKLVGSNAPPVLDSHLLQNFPLLESCVLFLLLISVWVVARGINRGLEKISAITVPLYAVILLGLAVYVIAVGSPLEALKNIFSIKAEVSVAGAFFAALTFAFLKFNVGMGSMVVYGSYLPYATSLRRSTLWIVLFDLFVALLCYFITFELVQPLNPTLFLGGLTNQNVMAVFGHIPHSIVVAILFFVAACLAVWTVLIAMLETLVATISERFGLSYPRATWLMASILFLLASLLVISQTTTLDERWLGAPYPYWIKRIALEILTPIAVLCLAIFSGWVIDSRTSRSELKFTPAIYGLWRFLMRFVIPVCIVIIFVYGLAA